MQRTIQLRLRDLGDVMHCYVSDTASFKVGDYVIVEVERGHDYAQVVSEPESVEIEQDKILKDVVRVATKEDLNQIEDNKKRIKNIFQTCLKKIQEKSMDMKLIEAEYSFDRSKIIFYFTSEGRVDFRELVKTWRIYSKPG